MAIETRKFQIISKIFMLTKNVNTKITTKIKTKIFIIKTIKET